ncbi:sugar phosphate isomerase/epimerase family protein [Paenibacillus hexagrammi]|uniref:Sugar phosphate isomerase/epimerase n=1 Tax=Paenibacillus hexagrammi TaxID=2908839 RepID=A0ABY3SPE6_9BACL|nr:TIM barrel protein [Paenibacillus sp. YPD9-1]UJF35834.1 sugar phosphate isomerase/epimerase [Paenibacillus sp. YPD9-1]
MFRDKLSISTWSLHRCLGPLRWTVWDEVSKQPVVSEESQPLELALTDLPKELASRGFRFAEVCHFHLPSTDDAYLAELKDAFNRADVRFHTLLVDYGDISSPDPVRREADIRYLQEWIGVASKAGADAVRIVAGEQAPTDQEAIARCQAALKQLQEYASKLGVRIVSENFRALTSTVSSWSRVVEGMGAGFQTIVDFGNFALDEKEEGIAYGSPLAYTIHAKPRYLEDGSVDREEFGRMVSILKEHGCEAPVSLIFDRPGNMWDGIERIKTELLLAAGE